MTPKTPAAEQRGSFHFYQRDFVILARGPLHTSQTRRSRRPGRGVSLRSAMGFGYADRGHRMGTAVDGTPPTRCPPTCTHYPTAPTPKVSNQWIEDPKQNSPAPGLPCGGYTERGLCTFGPRLNRVDVDTHPFSNGLLGQSLLS